MKPLIDQLRDATVAHVTRKESQTVVAHQCGMTPSTLSRFVAGKGGLSLHAAERLAAYLGLVLVPYASSEGRRAS